MKANATYRVVKQPVFRTWGINEYPSGRMVYGGFATKEDAESLANVLRAAAAHRIEEDPKKPKITEGPDIQIGTSHGY